MRRQVLVPLAVIVLAMGGASCGRSEDASAAPDAEVPAGASHNEGANERVTIPPASAQASGLVIATAGPGAIQQTLTLTGRIMLQPSARAEIHAPYPGPVRAVLRNIGDSVRSGEALARVESAESLQTYAIATPISGIVLERQTNIGDVTSDGALFVVGDLTKVQAELNVVTRDIGRISAGQNVIITGLDGAARFEGRVATVLPTADAHSQSLIARVPISVAANSPLRPGMAVRGAVVLAQQEAPVAVTTNAVQVYEGRNVVFVRVSPDTYEARPVTLGRRSTETVEITAGLSAGEAYVAQNAFLVKAELGKGAAEHDD